MRKFSIKSIVLVSALIIFLIILSGCPTDPSVPESAIFSGLEKIDITPVSGTIVSSEYFKYTLPDKVDYAIVELFIDHIDIPDDPDKQVPLEHLVAGSRTGLTDFTRSSVRADKLFPVNADNTDFDTSSGNYTGTTGSSPYTWIVLGYDENMNLTHASTNAKITITWP